MLARKSAPVVLVMAFCLNTIPLAAQTAETEIVRQATEVFLGIVSVPEKEVPEFLLRDCEGIAIIPDARKLGFFIGRQKGKGVLLARRKDGTWGDPVFITMSGGSIGWQVGVQSVDLVLFFRTRKSIDSALDGKLTLGVDVSVAAGAAGRQAGAGTDMDLEAEIYWYARTRGFFAGFALSGASLTVDDRANAAFYGKSYVGPGELLDGTRGSLPSAARDLKRALQVPRL